LAADNVRLSNLVAQAGVANASQVPNELLRLRGEVARLRAEAKDSAQSRGAGQTANGDQFEAAFKDWASRASQLKERLAQAPDKHIPELRLLAEKDWFDAVKDGTRLESDEDYRQALDRLRSNAKREFVSLAQQALQAYTQASGGALPANWEQLKPYLTTPVEDDILSRYHLLQSGNVANVARGQYLVGETAPPVDDEYDTTFKFGLNDVSSTSSNSVEDAVKRAGIRYAQANQGLLPTDPTQLAPYLDQPLDPAKIQRVLAKVPPGVTTLAQLQALLK
jgi:hypothetical protein